MCYTCWYLTKLYHTPSLCISYFILRDLFLLLHSYNLRHLVDFVILISWYEGQIIYIFHVLNV
jgi:hypothetical protein